MKIAHLFLALIFLSSNIQAQYLVSAEFVASYTASELNIVPGLATEYDIEFYKIIYNTVDANGNATLASGAFSKPVSENCTLFPLAIYQHGTTLNKDNVPSRNNSEAQVNKLLGGLGYYSIAPDYIGMGDSPGLHPYVHAASEATAGVDMVRAVREFLATLSESDNGEIFITGYSQGGHASMAMHKYIEDNDLLTELNVIAQAPGSGPYNLSGSQTATILSGEPYSNPGYIVYVLASYELAYGDIYSDYSEVLQSPHDVTVEPYFDGNNFQYSMGDLNPQLPLVITDLMTPEYYNAFESDTNHPFRLALADNDVYDWTPDRPIRMYYCTADEQVHFENSVVAGSTMNANGAADVEAIEIGPFNHSDCFLYAMFGAVNYFNSLRTECIPVGLDELDALTFSIYPNPVVDELTITSEFNISTWEIRDARGKLVMSKRMKLMGSNAGLIRIDTSGLSSGYYKLHVTDDSKKVGISTFVK